MYTYYSITKSARTELYIYVSFTLHIYNYDYFPQELEKSRKSFIRTENME